jgi:hypothetical protein
VRGTRRQAIVAAAAAPALLAAAPSALAAPGDDQKRRRSQAALSKALDIEQTAVVAYEAIANSGRVSVRATTILRTLLDDDRQHAQQLVAALDMMGAKAPIPPRRATIPGLTAARDEIGAADFAIALEARSIGAYLDVVRYLADANVLRSVAGAMGTDGQHLVVLRQLAGRIPVPSAFEHGIRP